MGDPNQGRYVVGSCLLDVINTLWEGDYARLVWLAAWWESFPENSLERDASASWDGKRVWRRACVICWNSLFRAGGDVEASASAKLHRAGYWGAMMGLGTAMLLPTKRFWVMPEMRSWLGCPCSRLGPKQPCEVGQEEQKDSSKSSSSLCFIKLLTPPPAWNKDEIVMQ